ncbi:MAG: hypothetical protein AAFX01_09660 [Cyanobacteria bacterium J06638_28]
MSVPTALLQNTDLTNEDYLVVGVAACYRLDEGELIPLQVLEPIPSAYLESVLQGIPTSYQCVVGTTVGALLAMEKVPSISGIQNIRRCQNFEERAIAAARTYKSRPEAQTLVKSGETRTDLNHSTEKKRVLNFTNVVRADDNVRQHQYTHEVL